MINPNLEPTKEMLAIILQIQTRLFIIQIEQLMNQVFSICSIQEPIKAVYWIAEKQEFIVNPTAETFNDMRARYKTVAQIWPKLSPIPDADGTPVTGNPAFPPSQQ